VNKPLPPNDAQITQLGIHGDVIRDVIPPATPEHPPPATEKKAPKKRDNEVFHGDTLMETKFDPITYVVEPFLVPGITVLAGKPKTGKSWLALDWSIAISNGGFAFGSIKVKQGAVLYLALEDNKRRLQSRIKTIAPGVAIPACLSFAISWPRLDAKAKDELIATLTKMENPRLLVVDVLSKVRPPVNTRDAYMADYAAMAPLAEIAAAFPELAILVLHHVSKRPDVEDPFDAVSGSTGLTGAADSVLILSRKKETGGLVLYARGRDIAETETALSFEPSRGQFTVLGDADAVMRSNARNAILAVLAESKAPMSPKDISDATGQTAGNVRALLRKMLADGEIRQPNTGHYESYRPSDTGNTSDNSRRWNGY
jgi:hypothetical protein